MAILQLPASLLALLLTAGLLDAATVPSRRPWNNNTDDATPTISSGIHHNTLAATGSGTEYATSCASAFLSYSSASSSWNTAHQWVQNTTQVIGGTSYSLVTYYENATTLCDGHPRVSASPAVSLSTGWLTDSHPVASTTIVQNTYFSVYPETTPACSIAPSDCDPLWAAYSTSMSAWQAANATGAAQATPAPSIPPCWNQSQADSYSTATASIYGCGQCTIYGQGVELVYFPEPTTVSRDMCASTPLASQTYYEAGAVVEAYAGTAYGRNASAAGKETAVVGQNTFTSGTAYISIATVYAHDRCSSTRGTPVYNAILAMPSESVLSIRYSQDHFKWAMVTGTQTGYPVSYADFNSPVPWSAWNGQAQCDNAQGGYSCDVIYDGGYRPQLAIPPEINKLNPDWAQCQLWYAGLYDPPKALQPAASIAMPTVPGHGGSDQATSTAAPSRTAAAPTVTPTALPDQSGGAQDTSQSSSGQTQTPGAPANGAGGDWQRTFTADGHAWTASGSGMDACIDGVTISSGQAAQTLSNGIVASYGPDGLGIHGSSTINLPKPTNENNIPGPTVVQTIVTIATQTMTVRLGNVNSAIAVNSNYLTPGGSASTLGNGQVISAGGQGLVVGWSSNVRVDAEATSRAGAESGSSDYSGIPTAATSTGASNGASQNTANNAVLSAISNAVIIDGSTITVPAQHAATTVAVNGATHTISAMKSGVAVVDGMIQLTAGNNAVTLSGGSTADAVQAEGASITIGSSAVAVSNLGASGYVIAGQTVTKGGQITVDGQTLSIVPSGGAVAVGGSTTEALSLAAQVASITIGSSAVAMTPLGGSSGYIVEGQTVTPNGRVTVDGQTLSMLPSGGAIVVEDGSTTRTMSIASGEIDASTLSKSATGSGSTLTSLTGSSPGTQTSGTAQQGQTSTGQSPAQQTTNAAGRPTIFDALCASVGLMAIVIAML